MEATNVVPLPYHEAIRDYLKWEDPRVWQWFASHSAHEEQAEAVRFDLLKNTYRIERDADLALYAIADEVAAALSINLPITIYQSQNPEGLNAALAYVPTEAHVVFSGPIKSKLNEHEVRSVLAHELTHHSLWHSWHGDFLIADQILAALTHDAQAHPAHFASARLFQLYTEIYCDRGSLAATATYSRLPPVCIRCWLRRSCA
jgi:Zn-dependent protease with chaperone function